MARRFPEAEAQQRRNVSKPHPHNAQTEAVLAVILMSTARMDEASQYLESALKDNPKNATALYYRGIWRLRQRPPDPDAAVKDLLMAREVAKHGADRRAHVAVAGVCAEA